MSVGGVEGDADGLGEPRNRFADELAADEEVRLSWTASDVRWANQWGADLDSPTAFAATGRRVLFVTDDGVTSIGHDRVRAVHTDAPTGGPDLSMAFLACGSLCLVVGLLAATRDFANGAGLVALSVALLIAGSVMGNQSDAATVTIIVGNERQRLSFSADESVCRAFAELVDED
jgi:hypothetical protein